MHSELSHFATRLREQLADAPLAFSPAKFSTLALELFALQFRHNAAYQKICTARGATPDRVTHWSQIPAVPTAAFKWLELTSLAPAARTAVFHSSGTTAQQASRHFHSAESLTVYEASLWPWFAANVLENFPGTSSPPDLIILTPPPAAVPHASLVHMFECVRKAMRRPSAGGADAKFFGQLAADGAWTLDFPATLAALENAVETNRPQPLLLLGTAFSFVHLLDFLAEKNLTLRLPAGSRVMETGGYKNRSRVLPKAELHALITARLGVSPENILCEYGMSELSSQAYDARRQSARGFQFPPWVRVQIISPETGGEVNLGETGLLRVLDLANVFSVAAIQTEDLVVRRADGFELVGRAVLAEPRGCSLMNA